MLLTSFFKYLNTFLNQPLLKAKVVVTETCLAFACEIYFVLWQVLLNHLPHNRSPVVGDGVEQSFVL